MRGVGGAGVRHSAACPARPRPTVSRLDLGVQAAVAHGESSDADTGLALQELLASKEVGRVSRQL